MTEEEYEAMIEAMMTRMAALIVTDGDLAKVVTAKELRDLASAAAEAAGLQPGVVVTPAIPTPGSGW